MKVEQGSLIGARVERERGREGRERRKGERARWTRLRNERERREGDN